MFSSYLQTIFLLFSKTPGILFSISFFFILFPAAAGTESLNENHLIDKTIIKIIENEKQLHHINLSDKEAGNALSFLLNKKGITLSSFSKIAKQSKIIISGLYLFVNEKENSDSIYKKLKMDLYEISLPTWNYYVKRYSSTEKIKKLENLTPDTMEKIIGTGVKDFKVKLTDWLLFKKIIADFDSTFPANIEMSNRDKEKKWWSIAVKKYQLKKKEQEEIIKKITLSKAFPEEDSKIMMDFFNLHPK